MLERSATISADVIDSTVLIKEDGNVIRLQSHLKKILDLLCSEMKLGWGRIVRGDGLEFVVNDEHNALRVALIMKCWIKTFKASELPPAFKKFGVRVAVGIGGLRTSDPVNGIMDGDSIYHSGRAIEKKSRETFSFVSKDIWYLRYWQMTFSLLEVLISHATARQCEVLFLRLQKKSDSDIANELGVTNVAVWNHLNRIGWRAIQDALNCFEGFSFRG